MLNQLTQGCSGLYTTWKRFPRSLITIARHVKWSFRGRADILLTINQVFADEDIGCDIPSVPESMFEDYNWFMSTIHLSRLTSLAYTTLFSTRSSGRSAEVCLGSIGYIRRRLEEWRLSVPLSFRPKEPLWLSELSSPTTNMVAIQTHYLYYNLVFAVERLSLHVDPDGRLDREDNKWELMNAARTVIELVRFIEIEPHVPVL